MLQGTCCAACAWDGHGDERQGEAQAQPYRYGVSSLSNEHVRGMFPEGGHWESSFGLCISGEKVVWRRCLDSAFLFP